MAPAKEAHKIAKNVGALTGSRESPDGAGTKGSAAKVQAQVTAGRTAAANSGATRGVVEKLTGTDLSDTKVNNKWVPQHSTPTETLAVVEEIEKSKLVSQDKIDAYLEATGEVAKMEAATAVIKAAQQAIKNTLTANGADEDWQKKAIEAYGLSDANWVDGKWGKGTQTAFELVVSRGTTIKNDNAAAVREKMEKERGGNFIKDEPSSKLPETPAPGTAGSPAAEKWLAEHKVTYTKDVRDTINKVNYTTLDYTNSGIEDLKTLKASGDMTTYNDVMAKLRVSLSASKFSDLKTKVEGSSGSSDSGGSEDTSGSPTTDKQKALQFVTGDESLKGYRIEDWDRVEHIDEVIDRVIELKEQEEVGTKDGGRNVVVSYDVSNISTDPDVQYEADKLSLLSSEDLKALRDNVRTLVKDKEESGDDSIWDKADGIQKGGKTDGHVSKEDVEYAAQEDLVSNEDAIKAIKAASNTGVSVDVLSASAITALGFDRVGQTKHIDAWLRDTEAKSKDNKTIAAIRDAFLNSPTFAMAVAGNDKKFSLRELDKIINGG